MKNSPLDHILIRLSLLLLISVSLFYLWQTLTVRIVINDAGLFAEMTRVLLNPELDLYVDLWDNKPPALFFFTAPFVALIGTNTLAIQIAAVVEAVLFALSTAMLAQVLWQNRALSVLTASMMLFYGAVIVVTRSIETTLLMVILGNLSLILILHEKSTLRWLVVSGFVFAWAVFAKQPIAVQFPAMLVAIAYAYGKKRLIVATFWLCVGGAIGIASFVLWGVLESDLLLMWQYLVAGNFQYSSLATDENSVFDTTFILRETLPVMLPLTLVALAGTGLLIRERNYRLTGVMVALMLTGFIGAALGVSLKITYFLQMLPFVVLMCAFVIVRLYQYQTTTGGVFTLILAVVVIAAAQPYYIAFNLFREQMRSEASVYLDALPYIREQTAPDSCLLLWGYANNLSYETQRHSCTAVPYEAMVANSSAFDTDLHRIGYMNDLLDNPPSVLLYGNTWSPFPTLQTYIDRYIGQRAPTTLPLFTMNTDAFQPLILNFSDYFEMVGFDRHRAETVCAGDTVSYAPTWRAYQPTTQQYQLFIHIRDVDGNGVTQFDGAAVHERPTQTWEREREILLGPSIDLALPQDMPSGEYQVVLGFYDLTAFEPLMILSPDGNRREAVIDRFIVRNCES